MMWPLLLRLNAAPAADTLAYVFRHSPENSMKKLKLDLDAIHVMSFSVETTRGGGTVNAFAPDTDVGCGHGSNPLDSCTCRHCPDMPASVDLAC